MTFKKIVSTLCVFSCFITTTAVLAKTSPIPTTCPSVSLVQQSGAKLDTAFPAFGHYEVITEQPVLHVSNRDWIIIVVPILENTPQTAIASAQQIITTVSDATDTPQQSEGGYVCYYAAKNSNVMTFTSDDGIKLSKPFIPKSLNKL